MPLTSFKLPVIKTSGPELAQDPPALDKLQRGFVLHQTDESDLENCFERHLQIAHDLARVLRRGYTKLNQVLEVKEHEFMTYGYGHLDGLSEQFWQVHHTHACSKSGFTSGSSLTLDYYCLKPAEHKALSQISALLDNPDGNTSVSFQPEGGEARYRFNIPVGTIPRPPDEQAITLAGPADTIVFPNGYPAWPSSPPGELFVHTFWPVDDQGQIQPDLKRMISVARIEYVYE